MTYYAIRHKRSRKYVAEIEVFYPNNTRVKLNDEYYAPRIYAKDYLELTLSLCDIDLNEFEIVEFDLDEKTKLRDITKPQTGPRCPDCKHVMVHPFKEPCKDCCKHPEKPNFTKGNKGETPDRNLNY